MAIQLPHLTSLATDTSDNSSSIESIAYNCNTVTAASTASDTAARRRTFCNESTDKQNISKYFCTCLQHSDRLCLLVCSHDGLLKAPIYGTSCPSSFGILTFHIIIHFRVATLTFHDRFQQITTRPCGLEVGFSPPPYNSADHSQFSQAVVFIKIQWLLLYLTEWDTLSII